MAAARISDNSSCTTTQYQQSSWDFKRTEISLKTLTGRILRRRQQGHSPAAEANWRDPMSNGKAPNSSWVQWLGHLCNGSPPAGALSLFLATTLATLTASRSATGWRDSFLPSRSSPSPQLCSATAQGRRRGWAGCSFSGDGEAER